LYFGKMNAALISMRDFQKHKLPNPNF